MISQAINWGYNRSVPGPDPVLISVSKFTVSLYGIVQFQRCPLWTELVETVRYTRHSWKPVPLSKSRCGNEIERG